MNIALQKTSKMPKYFADGPTRVVSATATDGIDVDKIQNILINYKLYLPTDSLSAIFLPTRHITIRAAPSTTLNADGIQNLPTDFSVVKTQIFCGV